EPTTGCAPLTVEFTDQSTGDITSWDWSFGDDESSTEQNPAHQYQSAGTFTVRLTVTGPGGDDTEIKNDYIAVDPLPQANFSASPTSGPSPLTVQFTDLSTGDIDSWFWDFGDDGTSTQQNPSHEYQTEGTYSVILTVTGPCGPDTLTETDYIHVGIPTVDVAMTDDLFFDPDPVYIGVGQAVRWTTTGTAAHTSTSGTGPNDPLSGQLWDSGLLSTGESFTHHFEDTGTYPYYCIPHFAQGMTGTAIICALPVSDINGDGSPDVLDILSLVNHILGISILEGCEFWRADCNQDGTLDILDALGIVRVILGVGKCP
ncbi:MAG: PKD domain-containing protein, partial [Gemmatimonadota bacterium]